MPPEIWCHLICGLVALLLCAENSFWYKSKCSSFLDAFQQAVASYMRIGPGKSAENVVEVLGDWPVTEHGQMKYRSALTKILLEHRLRASNSDLMIHF